LEEFVIQKAKKGDPKAVEMLYKHFYGFAMGVSLRYSYNKEEACEIVNDSFMKVFDKLNSYDSKNSFKGWFRRIIVNTAIDYYRKNTKYKAVLDIEYANLSELNASVIDDLSKEDILNLLQSLPSMLRIVFNMYEIEGYSHNEIAEKLTIPSSTSRTYLARAKEKLREKITLLNKQSDEGAIR
jgi:RNA polymerase sigma factor (sigma-70 family)